MTGDAAERAPEPGVGSPIIFRAEKGGPLFEVSPCSAADRAYWLGGYVVLSCAKCTKTIKRLETEERS